MLKEYLSQEKLVQSVLTVEELESLARNRDSLNLMMGLTFDKGQPLDMLKYSLFIMSLSDIIAKEGATVNSNQDFIIYPKGFLSLTCDNPVSQYQAS